MQPATVTLLVLLLVTLAALAVSLVLLTRPAVRLAERIVFQPPRHRSNVLMPTETFVPVVMIEPARLAWMERRRTDGLNKRCLVVLHGNATQMDEMAGEMERWKHLEGVDIYVPEYAGYSELRRLPTNETWNVLRSFMEQVIYKRPQRYETVMVMGHSLGTHFGLRLAAEGLCDRLVLIAPFTSVGDVGGRAAKALLPDDFFDSIQYARRVRCPTVVLHSAEDTVIPFHHGQQVAQALGCTDKTFHEIRGNHTLDRERSQELVGTMWDARTEKEEEG